MESSSSARKNAEKKESRRSKSKRAETIGFLAVEPESAKRAGPEHLGHISMAAAEKPAARPIEALAGKRIDTLSRSELLALSERIIIDGSNLRQIYETHLIGERGLRRLVAEYLRDGDLKRSLRQEIVERQIDFERDPVMRDMDVVPQQIAGGSQAALNKLLEQARISLNDSGQEAAFFKARALYEANQLYQHKKQRRAIDISLAAAITVLILFIIILYLSRN